MPESLSDAGRFAKSISIKKNRIFVAIVPATARLVCDGLISQTATLYSSSRSEPELPDGVRTGLQLMLLVAFGLKAAVLAIVLQALQKAMGDDKVTPEELERLTKIATDAVESTNGLQTRFSLPAARRSA
mgnify:CR=1 FL=1